MIKSPFKISPHNSSIIRDCNDAYLCGISAEYRTKEEVDATARLLVAAPELLEALEAIFKEWDAEYGCVNPEMSDKVEAIIKKARGL